MESYERNSKEDFFGGEYEASKDKGCTQGSHFHIKRCRTLLAFFCALVRPKFYPPHNCSHQLSSQWITREKIMRVCIFAAWVLTACISIQYFVLSQVLPYSKPHWTMCFLPTDDREKNSGLLVSYNIDRNYWYCR